MTERYDPKLVEAMCAGAYVLAWQHMDDNMREVARAIMRRALAAIDASGIAWVAPWKMSGPMHSAYNATYHSSAGATWSSLRDACLAERRGEG
jgi:hypothetical protein